jgi:hypothetical protein
MLIKVKRASTWAEEEPLKTESLDDLLNFVKKEGSIIIDEYDGELEITIYDDYIE